MTSAGYNALPAMTTETSPKTGPQTGPEPRAEAAQGQTLGGGNRDTPAGAWKSTRSPS